MPLKCTACAVALGDGGDYREHYRSEWHKYNLKRKTAALAPVPEALFQRKREEYLRRSGATHAANVPQDTRRRAQKGKRALNAARGGPASSETALTLGGSDYDDRRVDVVNRLPQAVRLLGRSVEAPSRSEDASTDEETEERGSDAGEEGGAGGAWAGTAGTLPHTGRESVGKRSGATNHRAEADDADDLEAADPGAMESELDTDEAKEGEGPTVAEASLAPEVCMFCDALHATPTACLEHMRVRHGFFLPEASYLADELGLLRYLHEKVKRGHMCLYCNGYGQRERTNDLCRVFPTARAAQAHMRDKGHCMLSYEEGIDLHEYEPYYDFTRSYLAASGASLAELEAAGDEEVDLEEMTAYTNEMGELVLPSGRVLGHREYQRFYDQRGRDPEAVRNPATLAVEADRRGAESAALARGGPGGALQKRLAPWQLRKVSGYGSGGAHNQLAVGSTFSSELAAREVRRAARWAKRQQLNQSIKNNTTGRMHIVLGGVLRGYSN